ncbi:MAG TPA: ATP-binding cassette domain-containing protein, partial [Candidatus Limnocylindria bacterium]|nr:ATP-binding cassette domain-containing protein [Candidatus Limnocylindria bacterium]
PSLKGDFLYGTNVKPGYYAQSHEQLRGSGAETPLTLILRTYSMSEEAARTYLGRFLFTGDDVYKQLDALSGGERSRLALAVLLLQQANFLILDEPTNHLDIHARETLEEMLSDFDGTILFVSHDRYFMDRIATKLWVVEDGGIAISLGNYTDFQRRLAAQKAEAEPVEEAEAPKVEPAPEPAPEPAANGQIERTAKGKPRKRSDAGLQRSLTQAEREIGKLEGKLNEISDALSVASIDKDVEAVSRLGAEFERIQSELDGAYARWEDLTKDAESLLAAANA